MSNDLLVLVVTIAFLLTVALWTLMKDRRYASRTLTEAADNAVHQARGVARRRAAASSLPIPTHLTQDRTPIEGMSLPGPAITVTIGPDTAEFMRQPRRTAQPYSMQRKRGTLKISDR